MPPTKERYEAEYLNKPDPQDLYIRRLENAFLMAYDLAGIDATPLPEALPESAYVPGYMDKVRELREVFAIASQSLRDGKQQHEDSYWDDPLRGTNKC